MGVVTIPNGWAPRPYQLPAWSALENGCKRAALVWHRRAGKDAMSCNWTAAAAMQRVGLYWHMAPTQRQVRKIVWDGIGKDGRRVIDQAFPHELRAGKDETEMKIRLVNGSLWQCVGSDNYDSLVGANPVGVVFSEWSLADPTAWDYVRPILAENDGWALFIYTPRGKNHGLTLLDTARSEPGWFAQVLTVEDTKAVPLEIIEQERRELTIQHGREDAETIIQQEWYCSFLAKLRGSIYGSQMEALRADGRLTRVPFDKAVPVNTFWDIGRSDTTAIWFHQYIALQNRFPRSYENSGEMVPFYAAKIQEFQQKYGIVYGTHYLPHDAAHDNIRGDSVEKQLRALLPGHRIVVNPPTNDIWLGIGNTRSLLASSWFDAEGCAGGITALDNYRKKYNNATEEFMDAPVHDRYSNYADALRTCGEGYKPALRAVASTEQAARKKRSRGSSTNWRTV